MVQDCLLLLGLDEVVETCVEGYVETDCVVCYAFCAVTPKAILA